MQGCTLQCQSPRTDSLHHGLQGYSTGMGFVVWNMIRKKKKKSWVHPITSQRLLKGNFYSLYKDLKAHPHQLFLDISDCLVKHLINCWICLVQVFQDTRMRKSMPPEEMLGVTLRKKKTSVLFLIHILFIIVLSGTDKKIQNFYYSLQFCLTDIQKFG